MNDKTMTRKGCETIAIKNQQQCSEMWIIVSDQTGSCGNIQIYNRNIIFGAVLCSSTLSLRVLFLHIPLIKIGGYAAVTAAVHYG